MASRSHIAANLKAIKSRASMALEKRASRALEWWLRWFEQKMHEPKTGIHYTKKIRGTFYSWTASAPHEYPAYVTGDLISSAHKWYDVRNGKIYLHLSFSTKYSDWLSRVRPLLKESQREVRSQLLTILHP